MIEHLTHFLHESWIAILFAFVFAEMLEFNARLARWIVRRAARLRYPNPDRAAIRGEEWAAVIDSRPGQTLKLATAAVFTLGALRVGCPRLVRATLHWVKRNRVPFAGLNALGAGLALAQGPLFDSPISWYISAAAAGSSGIVLVLMIMRWVTRRQLEATIAERNALIAEHDALIAARSAAIAGALNRMSDVQLHPEHYGVGGRGYPGDWSDGDE